MSRVPTTSAVGEEETSTSKEDLSLEQKIGMAKKFDREMKDYAKATVKEFLGIYGYEEDVDINMEESDTQKGETSSTQNATGTDRPIESEPSTSTDCDNLGDKTQLNMIGAAQAQSVVTVNCEACDTNEVSEISISCLEEASGPGSGCAVTIKEVYTVSSRSDEVSDVQFSTVTETISEVIETTEVDTSNLEHETSAAQPSSQLQCGVGARKGSQGEIQLCRNALISESQNQLITLQSQSIEIPALQEKEQSQSKTLSESQDELETLTSEENAPVQRIEILGIQDKELSYNEASTSQSENEKQVEKLLRELQRDSERAETGDEVITHGTITSLQKTQSLSDVGNQNKDVESQNEPGSQSEGIESQDSMELLGTHCQTMAVLNELETQNETPRLEDAISVPYGPQGCTSQNYNGIQSQSNNDVDLSCENLSLEKPEKSSVRLDQTTERLATGTSDVSQPETSSVVSQPTPSEILDAISRIIPQSQYMNKPAVLQEHSYAGDVWSEDTPVKISQYWSLNSDSISNRESIQNQPSSDVPTNGPNIESSDVVPSTRDSEVESGVNSNVQLSQIKESGSSKQGELSLSSESDLIQEPDYTPLSVAPSIKSIKITTVHISSNQPGLDSVIELSPMQLPVFSTSSNSSLEAVQPKALNTSPSAYFNPKEKSRLQRQKYRENETPEKRETRLRLQRERARVRRSNESDAEREARREKDRRRQQLKRARDSSKRKESGDTLDTASQTLQTSESNILVKARDLLSPDSHISQSNTSEIARTIEGSEMHWSSAVERDEMATSDATNASPPKKAKTIQDSGSTNTLVMSERRERTDGRQSDDELESATISTQNSQVNSNIAVSSVDLISTGIWTIQHENNSNADVSSSSVSSTAQILEDTLEDEGITSKKEIDNIQQKRILSDVQEIPAAQTLTSVLGCSNLRKDRDLATSSSFATQISQDPAALPEDKEISDGIGSLKPGQIVSEVSKDISLEIQAQSSECIGLRKDKEITTSTSSGIQTSQDHSHVAKIKGKIDERDDYVSTQIPTGVTETNALQVHASEPSDLKEGRDVTATTSSVAKRSEDNADDSASSSMNKKESSEHNRDKPEDNQVLSKTTKAASSTTKEATSEVSIPHEDDGRTVLKNSAIAQALLAKPKRKPREKNPDASVLSQKEKNRLRMNKRRSSETPEQREARLKGQRERVKKRRTHESETERQVRRWRDKIRQQVKRTSESTEARSKRLSQQRDAARRRRALESPEAKETRRIKDRDRARKSRESKRAVRVMVNV